MWCVHSKQFLSTKAALVQEKVAYRSF